MIRVRTSYSFRQAAGKIDDVMMALQEKGYSIAPITDRASAFGWAKWTKLSEKLNMRPVYGVELAVTDQTPEVRAERKERRLNADHFTFIAKDSLVPVNKLSTDATEISWYEPIVYYHQLKNIDLWKVAGNATKLDLINVKDPNTFVSLSPSSPVGHIKRAIEKGFKLVAAFDNRYPRDGDKSLYEVVCGKNARLQSYPQWIISIDEWKEAVAHIAPAKEIKKAITNAQMILDNSTALLPQGELLHPQRPKGGLRALCVAGAKKLGINLNDKQYSSRLERELKLIAEKKFEDYFYIIADMVAWARQHMLVGPARGSSCGSLVCYLTGITTVDPLKYDLLFERFIDINRMDLPDIDIDFSDVQREKVFKYMKDKYGEDRVARLGTVAVYRPRSALAEAAESFGIPRWRTDRVAEALIVRSSADSRALDTLEDTLRASDAGKKLLADHPEMIISTRMEGHPRHSSQHAAGILITEKPIDQYLPISFDSKAVHADKKDAEALGLLKIDALGLTQLSIFEDVLRMLGKGYDYIYNIPLDDVAAVECINQRKFAGIFQFNGIALQSLSKVVHVDGLDDLITITALARPGPMASGGASTWVRRKNGNEPVSYPHKAFEPYLKDTMGIVTYQEQVMTIGREIGDLSWEDVTKLRKAMSASLGVEYFNQFGDRWKAGARKKGLDPSVLDKIWDDMCAYGSWAFNKSHSVAYGIISYWCCWLKTYHPYEFAAATLSHEHDEDKQLKTLRELDDEGIKFIPFDKHKSTDKWTVIKDKGEKKLLGPLTIVRGIGPAAVDEIMAHRRRPKEVKLSQKVEKLMDSARVELSSLWPIRDAFKRERQSLIDKRIVSEPRAIGSITEEDHESELVVFCVLSKIDLKDENEAVKVAQRGGKVITGEPTASLNLFLKDDTGIMFGKITRWDHERMGVPIVERGGPNKHLYVAKGIMKVSGDFTMMLIRGIRYIGPYAADSKEKKAA